MPFPLAHPAAVLPLRRCFSRLLSFPALVIGSIAPDAGYAFNHLGDLSHHVRGLLLFSLPVGLMAWLGMAALGRPLVKLLPEPLRTVVLPAFDAEFKERPAGARTIAILVLSLLIGAATHILWDSATHRDGWIVQHVPLLRQRLMPIGHRWLRLCYVLWYGSTFVGAACLGAAYQKWRFENGSPSRAGFSSGAVFIDALLLGAVILPISIAHHLWHGVPGSAAVAILSVSTILAFIFLTEWRARTPGVK